MASLLIQNIGLLVQAEKRPRQVVKGAEMRQLPTIPNAFLLVENDRIAAFGPMERRPERADTVIDASGRLVLPSWCDAHTHLVFPAPRDEEFVDRIRGLSYEEIARRGGGILHSAHQMRQMTEETLLESTWQRLCEVMSQGTGAIEIKSGYGLTLESELKMLRVIRRLKALSPIPIKATFLGAHALPEEYRTRRGDYVDLVIHQMLPRIAERLIICTRRRCFACRRRPKWAAIRPAPTKTIRAGKFICGKCGKTGRSLWPFSLSQDKDEDALVRADNPVYTGVDTGLQGKFLT